MNTTNKRKDLFEEIKGTTDEIISQIKQLLQKGNARRAMIINKKGKVVFQTQLTAGLGGTALLVIISPLIAAIGFFGVVLSDMRVVVEKYPDEDAADGYEVEAEVIEIDDDEEENTDPEPDINKVDKTVGKDE